MLTLDERAAATGAAPEKKTGLDALIEKARANNTRPRLIWSGEAAKKYNNRAAAQAQQLVSAFGALAAERSRAETASNENGFTHQTGKLPFVMSSQTAGTDLAHLSGKLDEPVRRPTTGGDVDAALEERKAAHGVTKAARKALNDTLIAGADTELLPHDSEDYIVRQGRVNDARRVLKNAQQAEASASARFDELASEYQTARDRSQYQALRNNPDFEENSRGDAETAARNAGGRYYQVYHRHDSTAPLSGFSGDFDDLSGNLCFDPESL